MDGQHKRIFRTLKHKAMIKVTKPTKKKCKENAAKMKEAAKRLKERTETAKIDAK